MIASRRVFEDHAGDYDRWFDEHGEVYGAQVRMLRTALPESGRGLEVGVGSGRFAVPFGIRFGVDPSRKLVQIAQHHEIEVVVGEGEHLPYHAGSFDYVLMMTVICFLDNPLTVFHEVNRVLRPGGFLIVGYIEAGGKIHSEYINESTKGRFLRFAKFRTIGDVERFFRESGFVQVSGVQRSRGFCVMKGMKLKD